MKKQFVIYLSKFGCKPLWKGQAICREVGNGSYPVAFIKKAKGATDEEYWTILDYLFKPNIAESINKTE
jgi:hypothetical protein